MRHREVTAENLLAATGELRDRQSKLFRATVALIVVVKEAGEGPWEPGSGLTEENLRRWLEEQVSRMEELKESLDQKRRKLAMQAPVGEKKGSAEEGRRYRAQEELKQEEMRRLRQQARRDQDKRAYKQGRGEGENRISSPSGAPLQASTNLPDEPRAPAKLTEIVHYLTRNCH